MEITPISEQVNFKLQRALLMYTSTHTNGVSFATMHEVDPANGGTIKAGTPVTRECLDELVKGLLMAHGYKNWSFTEPEVVASGPGMKAWWSPAGVQHVFNMEKESGLPSGPVAQPALFWVTTPKSLSIFALATNERPTSSTPLYAAPHLNVYEDGDVCLGTTLHTELDDHVGTMRSYWLSRFTHRHHANSWKQTVFEGGLIELLQKLHEEEGANPFPVEYLEPMNRTVEDVLTAIAGKQFEGKPAIAEPDLDLDDDEEEFF